MLNMKRHKLPPEYGPIEETVEDILNYVNEGYPPGDFLYAVLTNNLKEAFGRADSNNREYMFQIVSFLWNHVPSGCWGSPEKVKAWLDFKRQQREMENVAERKE